MRPRAIGAVVAVALVAVSCATRQPLRGQEAGGTNRKLSTFSFVEEGDLASLIVSVKATRWREAARYVPLEICVANRGLKQIELTRESFTLRDADGHRYPCASPKELLDGYEYLDYDQRLMELEGIVANRFVNFTRYESKFSPTQGFSKGPGSTNIVIDRVTLPKFGALVDVIYFPRPAGELKGRPLELFVSSADLDQPLFVKFIVQ